MHEIQEGKENISCKDAADCGDRRLLVLLFGGAGDWVVSQPFLVSSRNAPPH